MTKSFKGALNLVDPVNRAQVLELLVECEKQNSDLTANEFEMNSQLQLKYKEADADGLDKVSCDNQNCLEVKLRR